MYRELRTDFTLKANRIPTRSGANEFHVRQKILIDNVTVQSTLKKQNMFNILGIAPDNDKSQNVDHAGIPSAYKHR